MALCGRLPKGITFLIAVMGLLTALPTIGRPTNASPQGFIFTITEENDLIVSTDRHYTQGIRFSYLSPDNQPGGMANRVDGIWGLGMNVEAHKFGLAAGQNIYTPKDKQTNDVVKNDRPYAGWLYLGGIWQRRGTTAGWLPTIDHVELDLGIIGPESLAREAQTFVHELRDFPSPKGWKHQLDTEPGIALKVQRQWRFSLGDRDGVALDFIPQLGGSLGNVGTFASVGAFARFGLNLPNDFGVPIIDSLASPGGDAVERERHKFGFYLFAAVEGRAVAYTVFLDGNSFHDSHTVDKESYVGDFRVGGVFVFRYFDVAYTHVFRTPQFVHQHDTDSFGSLTLQVNF